MIPSDMQSLAGLSAPKPGHSRNKLSRWIWSGSIVDQMGRVFAGFAIGFLLLIAAGISGTLRVDSKVESFARLSQVYVDMADVTIELSKAQQFLVEARQSSSGSPQSAQAIIAMDTALEKVGRLRNMLAFSGAAEGSELARQYAELERLEKEIETVRDGVAAAQAQPEAFAQLAEQLESVLDQVMAMRSQIDEALYVLSDQGIGEVHRLIGILLVVGASAVALAFVGKRSVTRRIARPIVLISDVSDRIAEGETNLEIPGAHRSDEIGKLSRSLAVLMKVQLNAVDNASKELERQREWEDQLNRQQEERQASMRALADAFEQNIADVANEVATSSKDLHEAAGSLAEYVEVSSGRMVTANDNLREASAGMTGAASASDEFALSISEVSKQASVSSDLARQAASSAASVDGTIMEMTGSASRISQIVEVIASIAQRTNFLALNASIEAARAAQSGKGFAVVAVEVKELAARTRDATKEVEALIEGLQKSTDQSTATISSIAEQIIDMEASSQAIASAVNQQANAGQELAQSIDIAARNTSSVSGNFDEISSSAVSAGTTASQVRDNSENLARQSEILRDQVARFLEHVRAG